MNFNLIVLGVAAFLFAGCHGKYLEPEEEFKPQFRLPRNLLPIYYNVSLHPILKRQENGLMVFIGSSTVTYVCNVPTDRVILHSSEISYSQAQMSLESEEGKIGIKNFTLYAPYELMIIQTINKCRVGRLYTLSVKNFASTLYEDMSGLYGVEYRTKSGKVRLMAASQMEPTDAREAFPCFDEPDFKAKFTITLWYRANSGYFALSNMPPESYHSEVINGELWNSTTFQQTVPMSTYLLALVVCDFTYVETFTKSKVQTRVYARNDSVEEGETIYASKITPRILDYYSEYFAIEYTLPKSDQIAVPEFGSVAMENWGLVVYGEDFALYKKTTSSVFNKLSVTRVIAHELAHQWFGNLVSPAWWDDIWLNEGFATYVSYLGMAKVQPGWEVNGLFLLHEIHRAFKVDGLTSSHPLVQSVNSVAEIRAQFDDISYGKGASVLRMINAFMGEKNFVRGLTSYLKEFSYRCATHKDLFRNWETQAADNLELPTNLSTILETWTLQMGYPVVNIEKVIGPKERPAYQVTQTYFLLDPSATPVHSAGSLKYGYQWYIPLTYKKASQIGTDEMQLTWLKPDASSPVMIEEGEYIMANLDALGYYRVNYDHSTWAKLGNKLRSSSFKGISSSNRAKLIDDAFTMSSAGFLDITVALELTKYLVQEEEYVPWKTFFTNVKYLDTMLGRTPTYGVFSEYIRKIISPSLFGEHSWKEKDRTDAAMTRRMAKQLGIYAACHYGDEICIKRSKKLYSRWMQNPNNTRIISNTFKRDIYCTAIRNGGLKEWEFAWDQHGITESAQERANLRYGLSCTKEPWIIARLMSYCLNSSLVSRADGLTTCIGFIADSEYGKDMIWSTFSEYWETLLENFGKGNVFFARIINVVTSRFCTNQDLNQLRHFLATYPNLGSAKRVFDQAVEKTKINIQWRRKNEGKIRDWLEKFVQS